MVHKTLTTILIFSFCSCSTIWSKGDSGKDSSSPQMSNAATGALTGAAVGGGLGLLVGSTSGAVGEGLIVGTLAGGALGAGIGAQLDSEKGEVRKHKDNIIEQDETIKNQDLEIRKLKTNTADRAKLVPPRIKAKGKNFGEEEVAIIAPAPKSAENSRARLASGNITYLSNPSGTKRAVPYTSAAIGNSSSKSLPLKPKNEENSIATNSKLNTKKEIARNIPEEPKKIGEMEEKSIETKITSDSSKKLNSLANNLPAAVTEAKTEVKKETETLATKSTSKLASAEDCKQSVKEAERGLNASSDADRLFYLRRASRLCPQEANYHVELGKIYSAIGKNDDAKYEFRQAIDLDADNQIARDELSIIENAGSINR